MIKCPYCGKEKVIDFDGDLEATMYNFCGNCADIIISVYCDDCEEGFRIEIPAKIELNLKEMKKWL
jgi:transcription elongation factor Elf1